MRRDEDAEELQLLLTHADDHRPVLAEGLPGVAAAHAEEAQAPGFDSFYDLGAAGNDLAAQGYGVIAPEGPDGDRLLAAIAPLLAAREEELGAPPPIYRVPPTMSPAAIDRWRHHVWDADGPESAPLYQLILGDLDQVPLALQQAQAIDGCVGRLAFPTAEGYEAYVDKLLRWQRQGVAAAGDLVVHGVRDGTPATAIGQSGLVEPVVAELRAAAAAGRVKPGAIVESGGPEPSPDELLEAVARGPGGLLFTMSHGDGAPRQGWPSAPEQRAAQGAMSFGRAGSLRGGDLGERPFMPGGMWFMFACYGAGTPSESRFQHWLAQLRDVGQFRGRPEAVLKSLPAAGERPFVAALPQAALQSPAGPLAFIGHLDLAWTYSFQELDTGQREGRASKYARMLRALLRGDRVGIALRELTRAYIDKNQLLTDTYDQQRAAEVAGQTLADPRLRLAHLWMVRQDLAGYVILGDPAAALPRPAGKAMASARPVEEIPAPKPAPKPAPAPAEAPAAAPAADDGAAGPAVDLDAMVEAVQAMISGELAPKKIAAAHGISVATLNAWFGAYTAAGRAALDRLRGGGS